MTVDVTRTSIGNILNRTSGYLRTITSHSLQPYRGCAFGNSLCGIGCYVQHNSFVTRGRDWGRFLEARVNSAKSYLAHFDREARWARGSSQADTTGGVFSIFMSSATDPFVPQEKRYGITRQVLQAMLLKPPDQLIIQTHSHHVVSELKLLSQLKDRCQVRVHVTIETDRPRIAGLPPHACSVENRIATCKLLQDAGIETVVTIAPLLPIENPQQFFERLSVVADAIVIDHFVGGDGSKDGHRTYRTPLPEIIESIHPGSSQLRYRDAIIEIARSHFQGKLGVGIDGFAARYLNVPRDT